ncbi:MAG: hypothetical protein SNI70_10690, partial [Rikenellaceae bacterium]
MQSGAIWRIRIQKCNNIIKYLTNRKTIHIFAPKSRNSPLDKAVKVEGLYLDFSGILFLRIQNLKTT